MQTVSRTAISQPCIFLRCSCCRDIYLRRCEGDVGAFRLVLHSRKVADPPDDRDARRHNGSNVSVPASSFAPSGTPVSVAIGGWFGHIFTLQQILPDSIVLLVLFAWFCFVF